MGDRIIQINKTDGRVPKFHTKTQVKNLITVPNFFNFML